MAANLKFNNHGRDYISDLTSEVEIVKDSPITDCFSGKTVFVTGASGFLGHLYVEKLLRIGVKTLYIFLRSKRDRSPEERLQQILDAPIFKKLLRENPNVIKRVKIISGTLEHIDLDLSLADRQELIENVEMIIHSAADIRFDKSLLDLLLVNLRGTREVLNLAKQMKKLQMLCYVSTAYSNIYATQSHVEERFYVPPYDPEWMIKFAESVQTEEDKEIYNIITNKIINPWPNTYTFTKAISEDLVRQFGNNVCSVVVVRPSVIIATYSDPIAGWTNNISGLNGVVHGIGLGFIRSMPAVPECLIDVVCADMVTNSTFAVMCDTQLKNEKIKKSGRKFIEPQVFNLSSGNQIENGELLSILIKNREKLTPLTAIWYPCCRQNRYYWQEYIFSIIYHAIPGAIYDIYLKYSNNKIRLLPIYRKMRQFIFLASYFAQKQWTFNNDKTVSIYDRMTEYDKEQFPSDMRQVVWKDYLYTYCLGVRVYLAKAEGDGSRRADRKYIRMLKTAHYSVIGIFYIFLIWLLFLCWPFLRQIFDGYFDLSVYK